MEKFNHTESGVEGEPILPEKVRRTNKVLAKLALWGMIAISPLPSVDLKGMELGKDEAYTEQISKEDISEKVLAFENRFKESGLISPEERHEKPVIVVLSKKSIEENYSGQNGYIKTTDDFLSQALILNFVNQGVDVVERGTGAVNAILKEAKLGESGLVKWDERIKLGNWSSADYYVVSSTKRTENDGFLLVNEIINMKNGNSVTVSVESPEEYSDTASAELAKKTKALIQEIK